MVLGCLVVFLNLPSLYQVIQDSKGHIRTQRTCTIAQQQCCMHRLANFATLHDKSRLNSLANTDKIVVDSAHSQQRRDCSLLIIKITVSENDVVYALVNTCLGCFAEIVE